MKFRQQKAGARSRLESKGCDDVPALRALLDAINRQPGLYTTSSCAGRVALLELSGPGSKAGSKFLGKWHDGVAVDELRKAVSWYRKDQLWLVAQGPILHVACDGPGAALALLKAAQAAGFKRSGIVAAGPRRWVVEVLSTERMDVPLGRRGELLVNGPYFGHLAKLGNALLRRSQKKMARLEKGVEECPS